jgi:hypothetical protein
VLCGVVWCGVVWCCFCLASLLLCRVLCHRRASSMSATPFLHRPDTGLTCVCLVMAAKAWAATTPATSRSRRYRGSRRRSCAGTFTCQQTCSCCQLVLFLQLAWQVAQSGRDRACVRAGGWDAPISTEKRSKEKRDHQHLLHLPCLMVDV